MLRRRGLRFASPSQARASAPLRRASSPKRTRLRLGFVLVLDEDYGVMASSESRGMFKVGSVFAPRGGAARGLGGAWADGSTSRYRLKILVKKVYFFNQGAVTDGNVEIFLL
jgi:hypothetical protein